MRDMPRGYVVELVQLLLNKNFLQFRKGKVSFRSVVCLTQPTLVRFSRMFVADRLPLAVGGARWRTCCRPARLAMRRTPKA